MVSFGYVHTINIPQSTYVSVQRTWTVSAEHGCHLRFPSAEHGSFLKLIRISPNSIFPGNVCGKRYCLRFTEIILPPLRQNPVHECTDTHHGRIFSSCPDFAGIYSTHSENTWVQRGAAFSQTQGFFHHLSYSDSYTK